MRHFVEREIDFFPDINGMKQADKHLRYYSDRMFNSIVHNIVINQLHNQIIAVCF